MLGAEELSTGQSSIGKWSDHQRRGKRMLLREQIVKVRITRGKNQLETMWGDRR